MPTRFPPICSTVTFSVKQIHYSSVCGSIRAYPGGSLEAFHPDQNINNPYVDGISLTHGSPRQHIWTFAAANSESAINCPCASNSVVSSRLTFLNEDYFCDAANSLSFTTFIHFDDPLWDGVNCSPDNRCCNFNNPPWFYKQLPQPTTDNIEMRVCCDQTRGDEDIAIEAFELYIQ